MTIIDKRCGTCRFFEELITGDYCVTILQEGLPFWAKTALETANDEVDPSDGTDCDAWEAKP